MDFQWAMSHLAQSRRVRRRCWPIKHWPDGVAVWHAWRQNDVGDASSSAAWAQACQGWGGQIGADDPQTFAVIGADGTMYRPSEADRLATDWEFEDDGKLQPDNMNQWPELPRDPRPGDSSIMDSEWATVLVFLGLVLILTGCVWFIFF